MNSLSIKSFVVLVSLVAISSVQSSTTSCRDGKDNLLTLSHCNIPGVGGSEVSATWNGMALSMYDKNKQPVCQGNHVSLPGYFKIQNGTYTVSNPAIYKSDVLIDVTRSVQNPGSFFPSPFCSNGQQKSFGYTNMPCQFDVCTLVGANYCQNVLQKLYDIDFTINPTGYIKIDYSFLRQLLTGTWDYQVALNLEMGPLGPSAFGPFACFENKKLTVSIDA